MLLKHVIYVLTCDKENVLIVAYISFCTLNNSQGGCILRDFTLLLQVSRCLYGTLVHIT